MWKPFFVYPQIHPSGVDLGREGEVEQPRGRPSGAFPGVNSNTDPSGVSFVKKWICDRMALYP
jgi:hypothetical protein